MLAVNVSPSPAQKLDALSKESDWRSKEKYHNHHLQVNLESLGNALHKKDYYGKEAISEPQVWSSFQAIKKVSSPNYERTALQDTGQVRTTLRKEGIILENSLMNLLLKVKYIL